MVTTALSIIYRLLRVCSFNGQETARMHHTGPLKNTGGDGTLERGGVHSVTVCYVFFDWI